jgi:hypothetical protein
MALLEDILPQIRAGRKARRKSWEPGTWFDPRDEEYIDAIADDWELVPEPVKYKQTLYLLSNGLISYNSRGLESLIVETRKIEWSVE